MRIRRPAAPPASSVDFQAVRHFRRQSGFLIPDVGNTSPKGFVGGDSYYWAPAD